MSASQASDADRARRAVIQELESLQRAGVTHLPKASPPKPVAAEVRAASGSGAGGGSPGGRSKRDDRAAALEDLSRQVAACTRCPELVANRTQTVFGVGNPYARLCFLGEAPGADEDRQGIPFVGRAGQLLTDMITKGMGLKREDVYILNILRCRPPGNRNPEAVEAANCRPWLEGQLAIIQPEFICCLGAVAAQNLLGTTAAIGRLRGRVHDYHGIKVVCTYHPAYLLRTPSAKRPTWEDLQLLMAEMGLKVPKR